jgi:cysteine synthase A
MPQACSHTTLKQIGNTPLVELTTFRKPGAAAIWAKLEGTNPGGSIKDRIALAMVENAEKQGELKPGMTIIEPTSGNTGIGLALVAAVKGYRLLLTMPDTMSIERQRLFGAYGAELVLTPGNQGMRGAIEKAAELAKKMRAYMPQQFCNPANPQIHAETTGPEIIEVLNGQVDAFVAGVGTGGTITGVGRALRKHNPKVRIFAVEPASSPVLSGGDAGPHKIQGIGAGFVPEILDQSIYEKVISVSDDNAIKVTQELARQEGLFCGISSGANVFAAASLAGKMDEDQTVVTIICDTGDRYLSTGIYD